jgi:hypothetical protein
MMLTSATGERRRRAENELSSGHADRGLSDLIGLNLSRCRCKVRNAWDETTVKALRFAPADRASITGPVAPAAGVTKH